MLCQNRTDAELILGLLICTRAVDDFWAWSHERNGIFSVRSAYRMLVETKCRREAWLEGRSSGSNSTRESKSWTMLWKVKVPSKIKIFLWRLAKQSLSSADLLHHRNMSTHYSTKCLHRRPGRRVRHQKPLGQATPTAVIGVGPSA
jgi:hypothetical protein